jgi:hypothetical protein
LSLTVSIAETITRGISTFRTISLSMIVPAILKVIAPARYWITLPSPPYGLFEWATKTENLTLIFLAVGGISAFSLYYIFIHRKELIEHPLKRYFKEEKSR